MRRTLPHSALILAVALVGCAEGVPQAEDTAATATSSTAAATAEATASAAASPSAEPTATAEGSAELVVDWTVPFTITGPAGWAIYPDSKSATSVDIRDETGLRTVLSALRKSPDTPEQWVEQLTGDALEATEPQPVEIGSAPGHVFDVQLSDSVETCAVDGGVFAGRCYGIHGPENGFSWVIEDGRPARIWVLDVDGETVVLVSDAREQSFEEWVPTIEEVLSTLEWES